MVVLRLKLSTRLQIPSEVMTGIQGRRQQSYGAHLKCLSFLPVARSACVRHRPFLRNVILLADYVPLILLADL